MYCRFCGNKLEAFAPKCPYCGAQTGCQPAPQTQKSTTNTTNDLAIIGFIFSFFITIVGLICSIMGLKKSAELDGSGRGLSIAGICISAISILTAFLLLIILLTLL